MLDLTVRRALANPSEALLRLDKIDAERRLVDYIRLMWPVLEPSRPFVDGWPLRVICRCLEAVTSGQIRRLLILVPPGCTKSLTTNVFWPSWEWGPRNMPSMRYVSWSYSHNLTVRDNRRCRQLVESSPYQRLWGDRFKMAADSAAKERFDTDKMGWRIASSVGGVGTGERGDRGIIDDPHAVKEVESDAIREGTLQWLTETLTTRVNEEASAMVCIMQRTHDRDCAGFLMAQELGWHVLCLPMEYDLDHPHPSVLPFDFEDPRAKEGELLWPERFSGQFVEEMKRQMTSWGGDYAVAGQFQQRPVPRGGGMFKRDWFEFVDRAPERVVERCRGWDLAATSGAKNKRAARTSGVKMSLGLDGFYYIEDEVGDRWPPGEVERNMRAAFETDGLDVTQSIPQDPGQSGKSQKMYLAREFAGYSLHFSPETGSKPNRAQPLAGQAEAGNVKVVRGPWTDAFVSEACLFPNSAFKDRIDGASRAFARLTRKRGQGVGMAPAVVT